MYSLDGFSSFPIDGFVVPDEIECDGDISMLEAESFLHELDSQDNEKKSSPVNEIFICR